MRSGLRACICVRVCAWASQQRESDADGRAAAVAVVPARILTACCCPNRSIGKRRERRKNKGSTLIIKRHSQEYLSAPFLLPLLLLQYATRRSALLDAGNTDRKEERGRSGQEGIALLQTRNDLSLFTIVSLGIMRKRARLTRT